MNIIPKKTKLKNDLIYVRYVLICVTMMWMCTNGTQDHVDEHLIHWLIKPQEIPKIHLGIPDVGGRWGQNS
jgi:hypothetical protein